MVNIAPPPPGALKWVGKWRRVLSSHALTSNFARKCDQNSYVEVELVSDPSVLQYVINSGSEWSSRQASLVDTVPIVLRWSFGPTIESLRPRFTLTIPPLSNARTSVLWRSIGVSTVSGEGTGMISPDGHTIGLQMSLESGGYTSIVYRILPSNEEGGGVVPLESDKLLESVDSDATSASGETKDSSNSKAEVQYHETGQRVGISFQASSGATKTSNAAPASYISVPDVAVVSITDVPPNGIPIVFEGYLFREF